MMLTRFIILAGVLLVIGVYAPARAMVVGAVAASAPTVLDAGVADKKDGGDVPRPRPTPGPKDQVMTLIGFNFGASEQKKADTPPRPRPKPGPKEGGEDE